MLKHIRTYICASLSLLFILVLAGCSADDANGDGATDGTVAFTLNATRANTGEYVSDVQDCELIKWYRIVITTTDNRNILVCIDKTLASAKELDPVDQIVLSEGNYNVYAFANIDLDYLTGIGIKEGGTVPQNLSDLRYSVPGYFNATADANGKLNGSLLRVADFAAAGHYIPMTSLSPQKIEVTSRINQTFNIEVRRLFAKLEFVFRNSTDKDLQVNAVSVGDLTTNGATGSILLMNYEENRNDINLPYTVSKATLTHGFATPSAVNSQTSGVSHSFYVLESSANTITRSFDLAFNVTRKGVAPTGAENDYMRYTLTDPSTITLIHRNDWIVIPVNFIDWQVRLEARSYPPIGGYAEAAVEEKSSDEFVVTFTSGGDFVIRPFIRKYGSEDGWFGIDEKTKVIGNPVVTVDDRDNLFLSKPELKSTGEIIGRMNIHSGINACVTVSVNVATSTSPLVTKTLTRKIYITQK